MPKAISWRIARDMVFAAIPGMYVLGFIAWGIHLKRHGLGFHDMGTLRYLMAGATATAVLASLWVVEYALAKPSVARKDPYFLGISALRLFTSTMAFMLLGSLLGFLGALRDSQWWRIGLFWGAIVMVALAVGFGVNVIKHGRGRTAKVALSSARPEPLQASIVWAFAVVLAFGWSVIPAMHPEFGGGMGRTAQVAANPAEFPPELGRLLFPHTNGTSQVAWSITLLVLVENESSMLVRDAAQGSTNSAMFELPTHLLHGVKWIDRVPL